MAWPYLNFSSAIICLILCKLWPMGPCGLHPLYLVDNTDSLSGNLWFRRDSVGTSNFFFIFVSVCLSSYQSDCLSVCNLFSHLLGLIRTIKQLRISMRNSVQGYNSRKLRLLYQMSNFKNYGGWRQYCPGLPENIAFLTNQIPRFLKF